MKNALIRSVVVGAALCLGAGIHAQDNQTYASVLKPDKDAPVPANPDRQPSAAMRLKTVATRVIANAGRYYRDQGRSEKFIAFKWDYQLIDGKEPAIFALPDGKIGVQAGLLEFTGSDDRLAYVVGHAIGHVLSGHQARRNERNAPPGAPGGARAWACMENFNATQEQNYRAADEKEADRLALVFMRAAGYDVQESLRFLDQLTVARQYDSGRWSGRKKDLQAMIPVVLTTISPGEQEEIPYASRDTAARDTSTRVILAAQPSVPSKGDYIFILIDVVPVSEFDQYHIAPLKALGTVYTDEISLDGRPYFRILLSGIADMNDARKKQSAAQELGFKKADRVQYRDGKRVRSGG